LTLSLSLLSCPRWPRLRPPSPVHRPSPAMPVQSAHHPTALPSRHPRTHGRWQLGRRASATPQIPTPHLHCHLVHTIPIPWSGDPCMGCCYAQVNERPGRSYACGRQVARMGVRRAVWTGGSGACDVGCVGGSGAVKQGRAKAPGGHRSIRGGRGHVPPGWVRNTAAECAKGKRGNVAQWRRRVWTMENWWDGWMVNQTTSSDGSEHSDMRLSK
jgi:hypothetical protein